MQKTDTPERSRFFAAARVRTRITPHGDRCKAIAAIALAACLAVPLRADEAAWATRAPIQDTYIGSGASEREVPQGDAAGLVVGNGREAFLMFDVSGLAGVSAAKIRLRVTQCGTTEGVVWPLFLRVMDDDSWSGTEMTWNTKPAELRVYPSPVLATDDPTLAGYVEIPAGSAGSWIEADVTEAVRDAGPRGRLALHVYTYKDNNAGDSTPLVFASAEYADDASLRPQLAFQGAADASAASLTLLPTADTFVFSGGGGTANFGSEEYDFLDRSGKRETFMKFDLSGISASSVDSAVLALRMYTASVNYSSGSNVQFELTSRTDWGESELTWSNAENTTGTSVGRAWDEETPANAVRGPSSEANKFYSIELAPLVNQVLATGGRTLSLHIWRNPADSGRYMAFWSREAAEESFRPRLLVTPKAPVPAATRTPVQETFVSDYTAANKDRSFHDGAYASHVQVGCSGDKVQYGLMLFDASGLEDADSVRIRVASRNEIAAGAGALRVAAWTTDAWSETNMTWNTAGPWFPQPESVVDGTALDGETAGIGLTQKKAAGTCFEADVTAAARAAAAAGRMLTVGLFSNRNWPEFHKGSGTVPAVLVFPDPDAEFGARVVASLDEGGGAPALRLSWSPLPSGGGEYAVERLRGADWRTVASGLSEPTCLDASAEPWTEHTYRITALDAADGTSSSVVKTVAVEPRKTVFACADAYVYGGAAETAYGTDSMAVVKYQGANNGKREVFLRFPLADVPERFLSATLRVNLATDSADETGDEKFSVAAYPDFEWSDAAAPTWSGIYGGTSAAETELAQWTAAEGQPLAAGDVIPFDVTVAIRAALAAGKTHVTLHLYAYDPQGKWNFGLVTRERTQGVSIAPRIEFALRNWVRSPFMLIVR